MGFIANKLTMGRGSLSVNRLLFQVKYVASNNFHCMVTYYLPLGRKQIKKHRIQLCVELIKSYQNLQLSLQGEVWVRVIIFVYFLYHCRSE